MKRLVYSALAFALCLSSAKASITFNSTVGFLTDSNASGAPASASADFSINGSGQLVMVLSNTIVNPWQDSQNVGGISFQINNFGSASFRVGTLASISGDSISSTPLNTDITGLVTIGGASLVNTPWTVTSGTSMNHGANFTSYDAVGQNSIVGIPTTVGGKPEYTLGTCISQKADGSCGSSNVFGKNSGDNPMIFETATFVFNLSGVAAGALADLSGCTTGQTCISNVQFGFGPDGPDSDDVTAGLLCADCGGGGQSEVPEPSAWSLMGAGLLAVLLLRRKSRIHAIR